MGCGFCESALSNSVGTLVVDCVVKPVGRQLDYLRRYHDNVEKLMERKGELTREQDRLQREINEAEGQLLQIEPGVRDLLSKVDKILSAMETLEEEIQQNKRCFNWSWRYRLSKKAMKKTQDTIELLEETKKFGQPGRVGYPATSTLPTIEFLCSKEFEFSKSSIAAFNQIIDALNDDNTSKIGLWGMGGVGKTTLVREVGSQAKKLNFFDKVVITTVSRKPNFEAIQDEIAQFIGFDMKNEQGRRSEQELWLRLKNEKRILIILDDVWTDINLKEIGIPLGEDHKGCKILLTTRRQQVCLTMDCQKVVSLGCLDGDEAKSLFAKKAGLNDSFDAVIEKLADLIIKKCQGLPIAIVTLGSALKGKSHHGWEAAYRRLKTRRLTEIEDVNEENAYLCLEASFDYLKDMETKICFLLCSLFPEDYEIYVEDLVRYAWGLELYKDINSIEEVRSEVLAAIDILKNSCLLLDCGERHVKMHDMVREVALWIASSKKEISFDIKFKVVETWLKDKSFEHYTAISFWTSQVTELPEGLLCPNLQILLLGEKYGSRMITSNEIFEGMKALKVCALDNIFLSLAAFQFLTNLRNLHLKRCKLSDISILGKLKTLQVLSFSRSNIIELPDGIGDLENLRLLDLSNCENLRRVPPHLIQRLSNLEELYLDGCLINWATENATREESFASLSELNSLSNLIVLSLDISSKHLPKDFVFCKLQKYDVCIGIRRYRYFKKDFENCPISRSLKIEASVDACKQLFEDIESLDLKKLVGCQNLVPSLELKLELDQRGFNKLTSLDLQSCEYMKCLIDTSKQQALTTAFSNLVNLSLRDMLGLEGLCNGPQPQGFLQKLKTLFIDSCKEMICAIPILQNLEELIVKSCDKMQVLFQIAELRSIQQGPSHPVSLQSLKVVEIDSFNNLKFLFPMSVANCLGQLETLKIKSCLGLEEIIRATEVSDISLQSLRKVHVEECNNLTSLFSLSQGQSLENLTALVIRDCFRLEYTFPISMAEGLPQLNEVHLKNLPQFKGRDGNDIVLTLSSLQKLEVEDCPQLTPFTISAKIQELKFVGMRERKQMCNMIVLELRGRSANMEYLTITNFEDLFDSGYNLSSLRILRLEAIPKLRVIWKEPIQVVNFQNLTDLTVDDCRRLRYIFSPTIARNLPQLSSLRIFSCDELEQIIEKDQTSSQDHHLQPICFPNLTQIVISRCENLKCLFPVTVAHSGLPKLKLLNVQSVSKLVQVFEEGDEANVSMDKQKVIQLPQFNSLKLFGLPNIVSFSPVGYHFVFPSLLELSVRDCPNITTRFSVDSKQSAHAKTQATPSFDEIIVEESATAPETTWPIGSCISWWYYKGR